MDQRIGIFEKGRGETVFAKDKKKDWIDCRWDQ